LHGEEQELQFVMNFRELMRIKNILISFADFKFGDTNMSQQMFEDFKSKYLDIYDRVRSEHAKEKVSILEDVDFELELIRRDEINVDYIVRLLARLVDTSGEQREKLINNIMNIMSADAALRSKRDLIRKFIDQNIPHVSDSEEVEAEFDKFWSKEETEAFEKLCREEGIAADKLHEVIGDYLFSGRKPSREDLAETLVRTPKILERDSILTKISKKLSTFIETFIEGV